VGRNWKFSGRANNARLLRELSEIELVRVAPAEKTARFVCWLAAAGDGEVCSVFSGNVEGIILDAPRGEHASVTIPCFLSALAANFGGVDGGRKGFREPSRRAFRQFLECTRRAQNRSETRLMTRRALLRSLRTACDLHSQTVIAADIVMLRFDRVLARKSRSRRRAGIRRDRRRRAGTA